MKKQQPAKKAAKKQSKPSIVLIEGKYSHKFLTRLKPDMGEILTNLMKDYKEKTFNGAIVKILEEVNYLKNKNRELQSKFSNTQNKFYTLQSNVSEFKSAFENLFEDKKVKEIESDKEDNEICPECSSIIHNGYCDECEDYV